MLPNHIASEFRDRWLPHCTESGLLRLSELLQSGSPLLIHGSFSRACAMGCLATHIAWHHPKTERHSDDAGIHWLTRVAKLNPATSVVIQVWDRSNSHDWNLRSGLLDLCRDELARRQDEAEFECEDAHAFAAL